MLKKLSKNWNKFQNRLFRVSDSYIRYCKEPIKENYILLEAGQGKNINGNVFSLLRELCTNPQWKGFSLFFTVRPDKQKEAENRFAFYQFPVKTILHNSKEYCKLLATAKYLITDNSFPAYFNKRDGQIYLNTWHGTSFKTLGKSDIQNAKSLANIQKNYMMADYALFANRFAEKVFMEDHMLRDLYRGKLLFCDNPRNSILLNEAHSRSLRQKLGLENKQLIAYLPTWRGTGRTADTAAQKDILHNYLMQIDRQLQEDQILFVNLHFLLNSSLDFSQYQHIRMFPAEYETYDFLALCDILITDYSSVFYDFAVTEKKIILFLYDLEQFMRERGTYFPIEELPFPAVYDTDGLIREINQPITETTPKMQQFLETFCSYRGTDTPEKIVRLLLEGNEEGLCIENAPISSRKLVLVYGGFLKNPHLNRCLLEYLHTLYDNPDYKVVLCFSGTVNASTVEFLSQLPDSADYLALATKTAFSFVTRFFTALSLRNKALALNPKTNLNLCFQQEKNRIFYQIQPWKIVYFPNTANYMYRIISCFSCEKEAHIHHPYLVGQENQNKMYQIMIAYFKKYYSFIQEHGSDDMSHLWGEEEKDSFYNKLFEACHLVKYFHNGKNHMSLYAAALVRNSLPFPLEKLNIRIQERIYPARICKGIPLGKNQRLLFYSFSIPLQDLPYFRPDNGVLFSYTDENGYGLKKNIRYQGFSSQGSQKHSPLKLIPSCDSTAFFSQSKHNYLRYKIRARSLTDSKTQKCKLFLAFLCAKLSRQKDGILLYENNGSSYENSASVLFEKLIDEQYAHVYYVLDKNYANLASIPEKYRSHLLERSSWKHYLQFFKAKTLIGTEHPLHALDRKSQNKYVHKKINSSNLHFILLKNGVSYAFAPALMENRVHKPFKTKGVYRLVCSSPEEAERFIAFNKHLPSQIYMSGLPKFDRIISNPTADKIVICPSLKPWEEHLARIEFTSSPYYKLIETLFAAVPESYHSKTQILLDPCVIQAALRSDFALKNYVFFPPQQEKILKDTRLFLTDDSSLACDAFSYGANLIFYWEKLSDSLEQYGTKTNFLLNSENIFGDICNNETELQEKIKENYSAPQKEEYLCRFQKILAFNDKENTQRLISMMQKDHLLPSKK